MNEAIGSIEAKCVAVFTNSGSKEELNVIRSELNSLCTPSSLSQLRSLCDSSENTYAHFFAAQSLGTLVEQRWSEITKNEKVKLSDWLSEQLLSKYTKYQPYVVSTLSQCMSRFVKFGWNEHNSWRLWSSSITAQLIRGNTNPSRKIHGLKLLLSLITEICLWHSRRPTTLHRKTVASFRDIQLLSIFQVALQALDEKQYATVDILHAAAALCLGTLNYDFTGLLFEECGDDIGQTQIPTSWRETIFEMNALPMLWSIYAKTELIDALRCITALANIRRAFFTSEEQRGRWISSVLSGLMDLLRRRRTLGSEALCEIFKMHARIKSTYQMVDLSTSPFFETWIQLYVETTRDTLGNRAFSRSAIPNLMLFWSRVATSQPYYSGSAVNLTSVVNKSLVDVFQVFVASCLETTESDCEKLSEEFPLADSDSVMLYLESIPQLFRVQPSLLGSFLLDLFSQTNNLQQIVTEQTTYLSKCAWLLYIFSMVIRSSTSSGPSAHDGDTTDAELISCVLRFVYTNSNIGSPTVARVRLEQAVIHCMKSFQLSYIGDSSTPHSRIYRRITSALHDCGKEFEDFSCVLEFIVKKILMNLRHWWKESTLLSDTLSLFVDLANGFHSSKQLFDSPSIQQLCEAHIQQSTGFAFLEHKEITSHRTKYYQALTTVFFLERFNETSFLSFLRPMDSDMQLVAQDIKNCTESSSLTVSSSSCLRDLRGICIACTNKRMYAIFFSWLYENYRGLLLELAKLCNRELELGKLLLKFFRHLVLNQQQRIAFDSNSPSGIRLFKWAAQVVQIMGTHFVNSWPRIQSLEQLLLMNSLLTASLTIWHRSLSGGFCNLGTFEVYDDPILEQTNEAVFQMIECGVSTDLFQHIKLYQAYFAFLDAISSVRPNYVCAQSTSRFIRLLQSIEAAMEQPGVSKTAMSSACASLHHICSHMYVQVTTQGQQLSLLSEHLQADPELLRRIMESLFHLLLFDERMNTWSISRPLLPLILLCPEKYHSFRTKTIEEHPKERSEVISRAFEELMTDLEKNLEPRTREKFAQNVSTFRNTMKTAK